MPKRNSHLLKAIFFLCVFVLITTIILSAVISSTPLSKPSTPQSQTTAPNLPKSNAQYANSAMVAADSPICSSIGKDILLQGGNAVDSAIAVSFCLGLARPYSCGIGGGGIMLIHYPNGSNYAIVSRETAPAAANETMFVNNSQLAQDGPLSIAVPGEVKGLEIAFNLHGSGNISWSDLIQPSIDLLQNGILVDLPLEKAIASIDIFSYPVLASIFAPSGVRLKSGDIYFWPSLKSTYESLALNGAEEFYNGTIGTLIANDIQSLGGILTASDLQQYNISHEEPVSTWYHGKKIVSSPPPYSGAVSLMAFNILEEFNLATQPQGLAHHLIAESWKTAYADRLALADPDYVANVSTLVVPTMLDKNHAGFLRQRISESTTFDPPHYEDLVPISLPSTSHGTSHVSIIDSNRMGVGYTTTINLIFGSKIMSNSTGIIFNDEMDDFSIPGIPNAFDLPPSSVNFIVPGKRPLSSMTPTFVISDDKLLLVTGASGGSRIITSTMLSIINSLDFHQDLWTSVASPRFHTQLVPNIVRVRSDFPYISALTTRNHDVETYGVDDYLSVVQSVLVFENNTLVGVSDPRKHGIASGY